MPVDVGVAHLDRLAPPRDLALVEAVQTAGQAEVGRVLQLDRLLQRGGAHEPEHGAEDLGAVEEGPRGHPVLDARRPQATGVVELPRLDEPALTGLERRERPEQLAARRLDDRAHPGAEVARPADGDRGDRVDQLSAEARRVRDRPDEDAERCGGALLPGVPEGGGDEVGDGEVDVGRGGDDQGVLARGLAEHPGTVGAPGPPGGEHPRGLARPGEHDGVDVGVGDEVLTDLVLGRAHHLQHVARHPGGVQRRDGLLDARGCLRRRLDDDGGPGRERGEDAPDGDGDGEVPRRRDQRQGEGGEARAVAHRAVLELDRPVGVVAREVDGLGDLGVGLGDGLARLGSHDGDEGLPARVQLARGGPQQVGTLGGRTRRPLGVRGPPGGDDLVDVGDGVQVPRGQLGHRPRDGAGGPLTVLRQGRVGVGGVGEVVPDRRAFRGAARAGRGGPDRLDARPEARLLVGHRRAVVGEERVQVVLRGGILLEAAHEVGDRGVEVLGGDDRRVEDDRADVVAHGAGLRGRHPLQHLDVQGLADPAGLREQVRARDVVEVVRGDTDAHPGVDGVGAQRPLDAAQVVGVDAPLRRVGRLLPAVHDRLDPLHGEVGALDETDLQAGAPLRPALGREGDEPLERGEGVGEVGLQDDARLEVVELRLGEERHEELERHLEVVVLLHVEVDEGVRGARLRRPVERAQPLEAALHGARGVPRADLADERGGLDRDVVDVGALEQLAGAAGARRGLVLAEHGLAEEVDVEPEAVLAGRGEVATEGRVVGVDEEVPDHLLHPGAGGGDDDLRRDPGDGGAQAEEATVDRAEEGGGVRGTDPAQGVGRDAVVLRSGDPVDEEDGQVEPAVGVGEQGGQLSGRLRLAPGLPGVGSGGPALGQGDRIIDEGGEGCGRRVGAVSAVGGRGVGCRGHPPTVGRPGGLRHRHV